MSNDTSNELPPIEPDELIDLGGITAGGLLGAIGKKTVASSPGNDNKVDKQRKPDNLEGEI